MMKSGENGAMPRVFTCRCEEVLDEEIVAAVVAGAQTVDDVKRRTRAGMGVCQGIYCMPAVAAVVAQATGSSIDSLAPMTVRPPLRPTPLEALADAAEPDETTEERRMGDERG